MTAGTVVSRLTGVVRLAAMVAALGIAESRLTDTYNLANTAPNILYELVLGGVVTSVFVPVFVELLEKEEKADAWRVISGVITVALMGLTVLTIVAIVAAPAIAGFYAGRLEGVDQALQRETITFLLRVFLPQIVLYGIYFLLAAVINANKRFGPPMWTPIANNIVLIGVFLVFHQLYGKVTLATITDTQLLVIGIGTTASVAPMGFLLIPYVRRIGRVRPTIMLRHPAVRKLARLAPYVAGFVVANQAGYIVVQWLANEQQGAYSAYISAFTFFLMPVGLFVWSITTALLPVLSEHAANERWDLMRQQLATGVKATSFLMVPTAVVFLLLAPLMTRILLEHGVATRASTDLVAAVLRFFVLGLVQFSVFQLFVRAFYAMQDSKTPFFVNALVVIVNVVLAVPLFAWFRVEGIAAAQAVANTVGMVILGAAMARRLGGIALRDITRSVWRICVAATLMGAVVWGGDIVLERVASVAAADATLVVRGAALSALVTAAVCVYLLAARWLRVPELAYVTDLFRRRVTR
ncbi:MAG: murein biosynthesis integral membrane protein MurJ [Actinobacteria bacterium]|nr:murein biosynthesis integral membrane protein MurJ [Actinomycetota bacterium]